MRSAAVSPAGATKRVLVKICGLTSPADARAAVEAGADLVGFVFVPGTPRAVRAEELKWIRGLRGVERAGVFRNRPLGEILEIREQLALDWVQLHGDEPDAWLEALGPRVLRRVGAKGGVDWERVAWLGARCLPLVDPGAGDGLRAEDGDLAGAPPGLRFGLAGGLTPGNVAGAIRQMRPVLVDVSSGVERAPGLKDPGLIASFVEAVRGVGGSGLA